MDLSRKMVEMLEAFRLNESKLESKKDRIYYAPNIPNYIQNDLLKKFDTDMNINEVVAFYDDSLFKNANAGYVFTTDGYYYRNGIFYADYYNYKDIESLYYKEKEGAYIIYKSKAKEEKIFSDTDFGQGMYDVLGRLMRIDRQFGQTSKKTTGQIKPVEIPEDIVVKCHAIIHPASTAAAGVGAGLAQLPGSDNILLLPIQVGMLIGLGAVFGIDIPEAGAKGLIANYGASLAGRTASQALLGWIPGVGNVINATTAAGITELMGWLAVEDFHKRSLNNTNKTKSGFSWTSAKSTKAGYENASQEYEEKIRKMKEDFAQERKDYTENKKQYEEILNAYEEFIKNIQKENEELTKTKEALEKELDKTKGEKEKAELREKVAEVRVQQLETTLYASEILAEFERFKAGNFIEVKGDSQPTSEPKYADAIEVESEYED